MMFTEKAQALIDRSKDYGFSHCRSELNMSAMLAAVGDHVEAGVLLAEAFDLKPDAVRQACPQFSDPATCRDKLPLSDAVHAALSEAKSLAEQVPDALHPGLVDLRHLVCAVASSADACELLRLTPISREAATALLVRWRDRDAQSPRLEELTERLRKLRDELSTRIYGQDHAIQAFVEGLFNAEVVAAADIQRRRPRALFVFAGPPGVGKTFLAELGASYLDRPFKRFDMTAYSGHQQDEALVGMAKSYRGAHPGTLTEFVEKNPACVLLFDEIEKAHLNAIHLFLQILDAGTLEDKFHERNVSFRDTTIIFTTNAGRKLYDKPNASGVHAANAAFHRKTILDALETEKDPRTGEPFFPAAICSRMATGYPVLFNHLRINELQHVVHAEIERVAGLLELQYYKRVTFEDFIPMCLILREGARADARTLCSQANTFVKTELFKFCQLYKAERLEDVLQGIDSIHFVLDGKPADYDREVADLFQQVEHPRVLLIAQPHLGDLYRQQITEVDWRTADTADDALELLAQEECDLVLLDLWIGHSTVGGALTIRGADYVSPAARGLDRGQELLRKIRDRLPDMPVYLLAFQRGTDGEASIDDQLFLACMQGGGARGMIVSNFVDDDAVQGWTEQRDRLRGDVLATCQRLHREKASDRMGQARKVLSFDTVPHVSKKDRQVTICLRNLRFGRAIAAADAGEILEDVERPRTRFVDVIGADAAKEELKFFIDYLRNPRRFAALGLKPPKGVLLHGPPGTGKTMLARAMAGESAVAFLPVSASSFVTIWQGSGPQNIRDLFARARRYAPAIVFLDEIDAIGRVRTGSAGAGQAEENTLNALLTEMDGFTGLSTNRPVFILAATNFSIEDDQQEVGRSSQRKLDPALVRRFSRAILVDLPARAAREQYLTLRLKDRTACKVSEEIVKSLAERSSGMSIANLESIIETAARNAAKSEADMTDKLLEEAFETVRFGEARPADAEKLRRTAFHEAGHTVLYWLSGWWPAYVTVVARGGHGGYMAPAADRAEGGGSYTQEELLAEIRVRLGGRVAEQLVYGARAGLSTGASDDLKKATDIAQKMVCEFGMDEDFGLLATPELMKYEGAMSSPVHLKVNELAGKILKEQKDASVKLLTENRMHLDAVTQALTEKERLTCEDLQKILPTIASPKNPVA